MVGCKLDWLKDSGIKSMCDQTPSVGTGPERTSHPGPEASVGLTWTAASGPRSVLTESHSSCVTATGPRWYGTRATIRHASTQPTYCPATFRTIRRTWWSESGAQHRTGHTAPRVTNTPTRTHGSRSKGTESVVHVCGPTPRGRASGDNNLTPKGSDSNQTNGLALTGHANDQSRVV